MADHCKQEEDGYVNEYLNEDVIFWFSYFYIIFGETIMQKWCICWISDTV